MAAALIQVYTGPGKGKTTAATGLMVRALGQGMKVLLVRFLKPENYPSGEILFLREHPRLEILGSGEGILFAKPDPAKVAASVQQTFARARSRILAGAFDLAVFDELNNCLHYGYLPLEEALSLCDERPAATELVFTGRNAPEALMARADLVSRVEKIKHPMDAGIGARRGIEY